MWTVYSMGKKKDEDRKGRKCYSKKEMYVTCASHLVDLIKMTKII